MQDGFLAAHIQLEQNPARAETIPLRVDAAILGRTVEISSRIADHTAIRVCTIGPSSKGVEHGLMADRIKLEHRAVTRSTAQCSCAVDILPTSSRVRFP